jgi:SAM-dependent methyltransferase
MFYLFLYFFALILELIFLASFSLITFFLIYSTLKGSPYVPTNKKIIEHILKNVKLKKGQTFLEIGCGDGRMLRTAVKKYQVNGIGIEVNPLIFFWAKFLTRLQKINEIKYYRSDIIRNNLPTADVIYLFLMPKLIEKINHKLKKELNRGTLIISHGFKIKPFTKYLKSTLNQKPFPTYFYKI